MEYLVAALVLLLAVSYAVFIAVNIEKGKGWALDIARAISMLDAQSASHDLRYRAMEAASSRPEPEPPSEPVVDRLAA
ncbi:MAG: hypothetical protein AAGE43_11510 [Pseudomonadota bacterium]